MARAFQRGPERGRALVPPGQRYAGRGRMPGRATRPHAGAASALRSCLRIGRRRRSRALHSQPLPPAPRDRGLQPGGLDWERRPAADPQLRLSARRRFGPLRGDRMVGARGDRQDAAALGRLPRWDERRRARRQHDLRRKPGAGPRLLDHPDAALCAGDLPLRRGGNRGAQPHSDRDGAQRDLARSDRAPMRRSISARTARRA